METYYQKNKEKVRAYQQEYQKKNANERAEYYRAWYAKNGRRRSVNDAEKLLEWQQEHPDRIRMQTHLRVDVYRGKIIKPEECSRCGRICRIHAHHTDYEHYTHIIWLCASCHKKEHLQSLR